MTGRPTSVIVCTHNRADLLPRVISQVRTQDYPDDAFEIVVVDNCSSDHTPQVVEKIVAESGVPVRYVAESRLGVTFARNRGAEVARYPYLAYLDDDCIAEPDWLSQLIQGFDLHDDVVAVGGQVVLDWEQQEKPPWMSPKLERWLAANSYLGTDSRLLDKGERIIECNMALERKAWHEAGGFLGMEQFGSKHMAAGEVLYLLNEIEHRGGKIGYVPGALVHHRIGKRTRRWMLRRAYWQGVSDGVLDYLIHRRSWLSLTNRIIIDLTAIIVLFGYTGLSCLRVDETKGMFHLMRVIRRLGLLLSEMHLVGDWARVRSWVSAHNPA